MSNTDINDLAVSTLRLLAVDEVHAANSGHPGAPLGMAPAAHALMQQMRLNPKNPDWLNRDRFVLSNGHACALLYAMLHVLGYKDKTLEDLKQFRQLGSKTPGHPEFELPGVEVTTGPLGQGITNAVGMAIAQANIAAVYNKPSFPVSDSMTYVFAGDGCLEEGISSEASSLAGHLKLGNLVVIYDDNHITIDGNTEISFHENVAKRYEAYGWEVLHVSNGDSDYASISQAIQKAKANKSQPTLIQNTTTIGFGSLKSGTSGVHGSPLKDDDIVQLKTKFGFDPKQTFVVPKEVYEFYNKRVVEPGMIANKEWDAMFEQYCAKYPELGAELKRRMANKMPENWEDALPRFTPEDKSMATRKMSEMVLNSIHAKIPELIGGSADLTPSNLTRWVDDVDFQPPESKLGDYKGKYIRYGIREHAMGAVMNGISAFGAGHKVYGGTFLNFVSYAAGAVRLSALSGHPVVWVATHDSIGVGEDGPTHQPIETLAHFRAMPNLDVWRPADGNEVSAAYKIALESTKNPSIIALSRQGCPQLKGSSIESASKGGYVLQDVDGKPDIVLVGTGSEVGLCVGAAAELKKDGINARVVSLPSFFQFDKQSEEYRLSVLPDNVPIMSVEVLTSFGWNKYAHESMGLNRFGASAPGPEVFKYFGFVPENVAVNAKKTIKFYAGKNIMSPVRSAF